MSEDDDVSEKRTTTTAKAKSNNIWGRITRTGSHEEQQTTASRSPGFFRKRIESVDRGELALAPISANRFRKKKRNNNNNNNNEGREDSAHSGDELLLDPGRRRTGRFRRRHTATLSNTDVNDSPRKGLFSLNRVGRKRKPKLRRESGCKSDGDSIELASDCSSVGNPVSMGPKRVGFKPSTKAASKELQNQMIYGTTRNERFNETQAHNSHTARTDNDDFFEAQTGETRPKSSFDSLPIQQPTIDSMPLYKPSVSFDSAPVRHNHSHGALSDYGTGGHYLKNTGLDSNSDHRPRSASDYGAHYGAPHYGGGSQHHSPTRRPARGERARYSVYQGSSGIKKKFRVRPYHCFPDGTQMTEEEIYSDSMKPSAEFFEVQSYISSSNVSTKTLDVPDPIRKRWGSPNDDGRIGSLRVEVLGCIGLSRTKPDVSVYAICGDAAFCTDVLSGYRSPMWPAVTRRACIFPIHHAYAKLCLGVFDCRIRNSKEKDFFCGRVAIDVGALRPNTEYDTTLPLRASTFVYDKRKRGVIRVRLSLHWFDERSAILSYFSQIKSFTDSAPLVEGQPTIPCADPKTFRNVAVTVYGQDLPGKYSKSAFKATMREFNLYQQNLNHFVKTFFLNIMLYERPVLSVYCLAASMYCVCFNSVRMVPAFFVGFIIITLIRNYFAFVEHNGYHLGYKPVTARELFLALVSKRGQTAKKDSIFLPISVDKKTKRRRGASHRLARMNSKDESENHNGNENEGEEDLMPVDHREFPFSDRDAYPKFSVEEALANAGGTSRLHGRLSIYYSAPIGEEEEDDGDGSLASNDSDNDEDTVTESMGDSIYDLDSDAEEDDEMQAVDADHNYKKAMLSQSDATRASKRVRLGPPQDADVVGGKKIPPQLQLKKVENLLYKGSLHLSVERVQAPPCKDADPGEGDENGKLPPDLPPHLQKKLKKLHLDDFDKLLGLKSRSANPVVRIMGSFMGPLMRMIRVPIYLTRVMFHISTWRDPFFTFLVFGFLVCLFFVLIIFPWRMFFLVSSILCLGPQNILVRRYLEAKALRKAMKALEEEEEAESAADRRNAMKRQNSLRFRRGKSDLSMESSNNSNETRSKDRRGLFVKRKNKRLTDKTAETRKERAPFSSDHRKAASSGKKMAPRSVVVPYSRLKKDRFFDWPPDPTVSRATALQLDNNETTEEIDSVISSLPDLPDAITDGLRQRKNTSHRNGDEIPTNISIAF